MFFSKKVSLYAPCEGTFRRLEDVSDPVFSQKMMGDGFAVVPSEGTIVSPLDGTVEMVFPTFHALGLKDTKGNEYILHVGIDTVNLQGQGFECLVSQGQKVKAHDPLLKVDLNLLKEKSIPSDVILVNTNQKEVALENNLNKVAPSTKIATIA